MIKVITFIAALMILIGATGIDNGPLPAIMCLIGLGWCLLVLLTNWNQIAHKVNKDWRWK